MYAYPNNQNASELTRRFRRKDYRKIRARYASKPWVRQSSKIKHTSHPPTTAPRGSQRLTMPPRVVRMRAGRSRSTCRSSRTCLRHDEILEEFFPINGVKDDDYHGSLRTPVSRAKVENAFLKRFQHIWTRHNHASYICRNEFNQKTMAKEW